MNRTFNRLTLAASLAVALGLSASAFAESQVALTSGQTINVVQYGDLNTDTQTGVQVLADRIQNAAWQVCQDEIPTSNGPNSIANLKCQQTLILNTVAKVNNPMLTEMYSGQQDNDSWNSG